MLATVTTVAVICAVAGGGAVTWEYCVRHTSSSKHQGQGAFLVFMSLLASAVCFAGVILGFVSPHRMMAAAIVMFMLAIGLETLGAVGFAYLRKSTEEK